MARYNLTERQKELLRAIVENIRAGKLQEPIIPVVEIGGGGYVIGIEKNFGPSVTGDLEVLSEEGLLSWQLNSRGKKIYTVKQAGYDAVDNDFEIPDDLYTPQVNIGAIVYEMSGGNLQAVGVAHSEIQQIVNDPELLSSQVEALANDLIETVKAELPATDLTEYMKKVEELKAQVLANNASPSILRRLLQSIAFLGDIDGSLSLMAKIWPKVYPFLLIIAERIMQGG